MRRVNGLFSALIIFSFIGFNIDIPKIPTVDVDEIIKKTNENIPQYSFGTYEDPNYSQKKTNFSPGQTIYFLSESPINENASKSLVLKDANKNLVSEISVAMSQRGYTAQFPAPLNEGLYYIHFEVTGEGLSVVNQTNINVGGNGAKVIGKSTVINDVTTVVGNDDIDGDINVENEKTPRNRTYFLNFLGIFLERLIELIINNLNEA